MGELEFRQPQVPQMLPKTTLADPLNVAEVETGGLCPKKLPIVGNFSRKVLKLLC